MEPEPPPHPPTSRRRKVLIVTGASLGVLVISALIILPPIIASIIRTQFVSTVNERLDATAAVGHVSFSWTGGVSLRDVDIKDRSGQSLASVKSIDAGVGLLAALRGRYITDVRIDQPRLDIRRGADGRLNVEGITKPDTPTNGKPRPTKGLPYLQLKVTVTGGLISFAGEKETTEIPVSGSLDFTLDAGRVAASGAFAANEGTIAIKFDSHTATKAEATIERVRLDARMSPILELLHPAFAVAKGKLEGAMDGTVTLTHDGPIDAIAMEKLGGDGKADIRDCAISGSTLLGGLFGTDRREIRLKPLGFRIVAGRIVYDRPWQWTISGAETTFTGSIGLDRTLDLVWHIPVNDELASKVPALKASRGKTIEAKIGGTVSKPKLDWKDVISQAVEDKVEEAAKRGIEDLLGGRDERKAAKLLEEADALHKEGKTAEAAAKYRKIKDDHRRTRVYKDNQSRIDPRAEEK